MQDDADAGGEAGSGLTFAPARVAKIAEEDGDILKLDKEAAAVLTKATVRTLKSTTLTHGHA